MKFNVVLVSLVVSVVVTSCSTKRNPYFGDDQAQFIVDSLEEKEANRKAISHSGGTANRLQITLEACLKTLSGDRIPPRLKFSIEAGEEKQSAVTNVNGCIQWTEDYAFENKAAEFNARLKRNVISKNDYQGTREIIFYWNTRTKKVSHNIKNMDIVPQNVQDPMETGFTYTNITATQQNSSMSPAGADGKPSNDYGARLALKSISLSHIKLAQDKPYRVDRNLELYVTHKFNFAASPAFFIKSFNQPEIEEVPPAGKYRISMVFMDDPTIDLRTLAYELSQNKGAAISLAPLVHTAAQFVLDKNITKNRLQDYVDIEIKRLSKLDVRSFVAVTIEDLSIGQSQNLKFNGIGYIQNLLNPGEIDLVEAPVDASALYAENSKKQLLSEQSSPIENFKKIKNLTAMSDLDIDSNSFSQTAFAEKYPFRNQAEQYFSNKLNHAYTEMFKKSLCSRMFKNNQLTKIESFNKNGISEQLLWTHQCEDAKFESMTRFLDLAVVDFVESSQKSEVNKVGRTIEEAIKVSRAFEISDATEETDGENMKLSGDVDIGAMMTHVPFMSSFSSIFESLYPIKFNLGHSWYYSITREKTKTTEASISRESTFTLNVNMDTFDVKVETKRCLIVQYRPWVIAAFKKRYDVTLPAGAIVCSNQNQMPTYRENYYTITQKCSEDGGTTDCASAGENRMRLILRGAKIYEELNKMLLNTDINILLKPLAKDSTREAHSNMATQLEKLSSEWTSTSSQTSQIFPGALIPKDFDKK